MYRDLANFALWSNYLRTVVFQVIEISMSDFTEMDLYVQQFQPCHIVYN